MSRQVSRAWNRQNPQTSLISYKRVTLASYSTHSEGGLTDKDFAGAAAADGLVGRE